MAKSVVLLGKGTLAIQIAEWFRRSTEYDLKCVVPVMPEPEWTDSLSSWCDHRGVPFVPSGGFEDIPVMDDNQHVDLAISVFYNRILPASFIQRTDRILNLHNSPLPRYRGTAPINWALRNGETSHGVTIHEITPGIDCGPIVAQMTYSIYPDRDEVIDVYARALVFGYALFEQTMPILDQIVPRAQDESKAVYYSRKDAAKLGDRRDFTRKRSQQSEKNVTGTAGSSANQSGHTADGVWVSHSER